MLYAQSHTSTTCHVVMYSCVTQPGGCVCVCDTSLFIVYVCRVKMSLYNVYAFDNWPISMNLLLFKKTAYLIKFLNSSFIYIWNLTVAKTFLLFVLLNVRDNQNKIFIVNNKYLCIFLDWAWTYIVRSCSPIDYIRSYEKSLLLFY